MKARQSIFKDSAQASRFHPVQLLWNWLIIGLGVFFANAILPGISFQGKNALGEHGWGTLLLVVIGLSVLNLLLKPLLILFTLPFVMLTFGLGLWLINACLLLLTAQLVPGFDVENFGTALWAALIISIISLGANLVFRPHRATPKSILMVGIDKNSFARTSRSDKYDHTIDI